MGSAQKINAEANSVAPAKPIIQPKEGSVLKDFRQFVMRGNVVDLAVAVVIGAAFGKVVDSFVKDVIMPPIGLLVGRIQFDNLFVSLDGKHYDTLKAAQDAAAPTINYGLFINQIISFVIVALAIFLLIRQISRFRRPAPAAPTEKECPFCRMAVPIAASRCPHCTSSLEAPAAAGR